MSGVNIPSYTKEVDGVIWTASWDDKGNISYKGVDKDGNEVSSAAPSDIIKAAHDYGAGFGNNENQQQDEAKQAEDDNKKEQGAKDKELSELSKMAEAYGAVSVGYSPKDGKVTFRDKDGKEISASKEDMAKAEAVLKKYDKPRKRSLKEDMKADFEQAKQDFVEMARYPVESVKRWRKDFKNAKSLGYGTVKAAVGAEALQIHDSLKAAGLLGLMPENLKKKVDGLRKNIEERDKREENPSLGAKMVGRSINDLKRLSGRIGVQSVKVRFNPSGKDKNRNAGR